MADQVNAVRSLEQQVQSQQQAVATAGSAFELAGQRYRAGIGNYLDVLSAQSQLLGAQQALATLHSQQLLAAARLTQALGGGYAPPADGVAAPVSSSSSVSPHS